MADLEALSNDELRKKLIEHGLGAIPLTATTRKVLINKLQKSINGEVVAKPVAEVKPKSRRETMYGKPVSVQVEKIDVKKSEKPTKRRATLDASSVPIPVVVQPPAPIVVDTGNSRRSGRITPQPPKTKEGRSINTSEPQTFIILDEEDENDIVEEVSNGRQNDGILQPPIKTVDRRRSSRSQSLGKSDTVTTSYKTVIEKETINEIIEDDEENNDNHPSEIYTQTTFIPAGSSIKSHDIIFSSDVKANDFDARRRRFTAFGGGDRSKKEITPPTVATSGYSGRFDKLNSVDAYKRRTVTSPEFRRQSQPPPPPIFSTYASSDSDADLEIPVGSTPYLSDFAKRLSCLRAEPLVAATSVDNTGTSYRYGSGAGDSTHDVIQRRRISSGIQKNNNKVEDSLWQSFKLLLISLERKLRPILVLALIVSIAVFVYVFFFTNN